PAVPRIHFDLVARHSDFAGDFADHDADDVRAVPAPAHAGTLARTPPQFFRTPARWLRTLAGLGAPAQPVRADDFFRRDRAQRFSVLHRAQGLLPTAGYRTAGRAAASRS